MKQSRIVDFDLDMYHKGKGELYVQGCSIVYIERSDISGMYPLLVTMLNEYGAREAHQYTLSGICRFDLNNNRTMKLTVSKEYFEEQLTKSITVPLYSTYFCISYKVQEDSLGPEEHVARRTTRTLYPTEEMAQANCKSWNKKSDARVHRITIPNNAPF